MGRRVDSGSMSNLGSTGSDHVVRAMSSSGASSNDVQRNVRERMARYGALSNFGASHASG